MNHLLLHLLLPAIRENFTRRSIRNISWLDPVLSIRFSGKRERSLVAITSDPGPFCFVSPDDPIERCSPRSVLNEAVGMAPSRASIAECDRLLCLESSGRQGARSLLLQLFGNPGGAFLMRGEEVRESVGTARKKLAPRGKESFACFPIVRITHAELRALVETSPEWTARVPGLEPQMLEAFVSRTGELDIEGLLRFRDDLIDGRLSFYLAVPDRLGNAAPVPAPLPAGEGLVGPFSSGEEACLFIGERLLEGVFEKIIKRHTRPLRKRLASRAALRLRLEDDLRAAQDHPRIRREAEILAAYQTRIRQGASSVELPDPYETDTTVTISLDPAIPIREQIRKRFNRASKLERSVERIRRRLGEVEREISALEDAQGILRNRESFPETLQHLERVIAEAPTPLVSRKRGTRKPGERVFRRFDLDAMWFVLVGRNNQENDELTFRVAGPEDLWLHAQHTPGSHVILKSKGASGGPPAKVLAAAAGIAAYFSRARHASLVPVIYTHRKYVRKPRGAAPGKVLCEREKTIFAEPVLPSVGDEEPESV